MRETVRIWQTTTKDECAERDGMREYEEVMHTSDIHPITDRERRKE